MTPHQDGLPALNSLRWIGAPSSSNWGAGMMCTDVAITKDETLTLFAHRDAIAALPLPAQPASPERKPLTDEHVEVLWHEYTPAWPAGVTLRDFSRIFRLAEATHEIATQEPRT